MKKRIHGRGVAAFVLAAVLSIQIAPVAEAGWRDGGSRDLPALIAKLVKKIQKNFGIGAQDDLPMPPRP